LNRSLEELPILQTRPGWADITAVRSGRVYFVDGNAYCNRPGPRLAETTEILAEMIHPEVAGTAHRGRAWTKRS
jgi:iron complex transport system substrate-binding protein